MCSVQKLSSTKDCWFPFAEVPLPYLTLKGIYSPQPRASLALLFNSWESCSSEHPNEKCQARDFAGSQVANSRPEALREGQEQKASLLRMGGTCSAHLAVFWRWGLKMLFNRVPSKFHWRGWWAEGWYQSLQTYHSCHLLKARTIRFSDFLFPTPQPPFLLLKF